MENIKLYAIGTISICMCVVFCALLYCRQMLPREDPRERNFELTVFKELPA